MWLWGWNLGVVLKVLVKHEPLEIWCLEEGILTKYGTYLMAILGTGIFGLRV